MSIRDIAIKAGILCESLRFAWLNAEGYVENNDFISLLCLLTESAERLEQDIVDYANGGVNNGH